MKTTLTLILTASIVLLSGCTSASNSNSPYLTQRIAKGSTSTMTFNPDKSVATIECAPGIDIATFWLPKPVGDNMCFSFWFNSPDAALLSASSFTKDTPMTLAFLHSESALQQQLVFRISNNKLQVAGSDNNKDWPNIIGSTALKANTWYFVTYLRTPAESQLYINGNLAGTSSKMPNLPKLSELYYGVNGGASSKRQFSGSIAAPLFHKTPLTHPQIQQLYSTPPPAVK